MAPPRGAVGRNVLRKEGAAKVSGAAQYIDDLRFPNLLHARTIRSTIPAGEIAAMRFDFDKTGFTIVDCRDVPGRNIVALIEDDQPCLAERTIRHVAEPILLLAHEDRERLLRAEVQIEYGRDARLRSRNRRRRLQAIAIDKGASRRVRGRRSRSSRASTAWAIRSSSTSSRTA
jgi:xanthine dehydrogenase molybdopterin-binding subunit B